MGPTLKAQEKKEKQNFSLLDTLFGIDLRALALMRICVALIVLIEVFRRGAEIPYLFSEDGVFPRALSLKLIYLANFSVFLISGSTPFIVSLFLLTGIFAFFCLIGYKTKLFTVLTWIMWGSMSARISMFLDGSDNILGMLLLWGLFLPIHAHYSVDRVLTPPSSPKPPKRILSVAGAALLAQTTYVYYFAGIFKFKHLSWLEGNATAYALGQSQHARWLGYMMAQLPETILQPLTISLMWLELLVPFLLFFPLYNSFFRLITLFLLLLVHLGFDFCLNLEFFPWVSLCTLIPFLPSAFWDKISNSMKARQRGLEIHCASENLALKRGLLILKSFLLLNHATFNTDTNFKPSGISWSVKTQQGKHLQKAEAVGHLLSQSPLFRPFYLVLNFLCPPAVKSFLYRFTFETPGLFTKPLGKMKTKPIAFKTPLKIHLVAAFFFIYSFTYNVQTIFEEKLVYPNFLHNIGSFFHLYQKWDMFAGEGASWYSMRTVIPATKRNGEKIDLFYEKDIEYWKTQKVVKFKNRYWRRFYTAFQLPHNREALTHYAYWLCKDWNSRHEGDDEITELEIITYYKGFSPNATYVPSPLIKYGCTNEKI